MGNILALVSGLGIGLRGRACGWAASLLVTVFFALGDVCVQTQAAGPVALLSASDTALSSGGEVPLTALRSRISQVNPDFFFQAHQSVTGTHFLLNLFGDFSPTALIHRWERPVSGGLVGLGVLEGVPGSQVILSLAGSTLTATVTTPESGRYKIQPDGQGKVIVSQINVASLAHCAQGQVSFESLLADPRKQWLAEVARSKASAQAVNTNTVSIVDLMVVYTTQAKTGAGGEAAVRTLIDLAVAEANSIYQNSRANVRLRLVAQAEVNYTEHAMLSTNLNRLRINGDGFMDEVHSLRETNKADIVCLITETADPGFSGLAFTMSPVTTAFSSFAYAVVKREDAVGTYTFAHEVSHILGCQHDRDNARDNDGNLTPGAFPYSFGYRFMVGEELYRTVMAYEPGFRIPYFSNPLIIYGGTAMGVPESDTNNAADNVKSLNNASSTVSAFFGPAVSTRPPVATLTSPNNGTTIMAGGVAVLSVQASDPDGTVASVEFFSGDTYIGAVPNIIAGVDLGNYVFTWLNVPPGNYSLTARVTDNLGASTYTAPVTFIARPLNDDFVARQLITGSVILQTNVNRGASVEANEPQHSGNLGGASVWYRWVAPTTGTLTLEVSGKKFQPLASVYTGNSVSQLTFEAESITFDPQNDIVRVVFDALAGTEYKLVVDGLGATSGEFILRLSYNIPPENNNFANRITLNGEAIDIQTHNRFATMEPGEPVAANQQTSGKSIWYAWTAPRNGAISILVDANDFFPLTDAFTGNAVNALTVVPNRRVSFNQTNLTTEVSFDVVGGQTYALVVDGLSGGSGDVQFKLFYQPPPVNDMFADRLTILGTDIQFNTSNLYASLETGEPQHVPPNANGRSIWYSWVAPVSGPVTITAVGTNSFFVLSSVYRGTNVSALQRVSAFSINQATFTSTVTFTAVAFQRYEIALAGFNSTSGTIGFRLATQNVPPAVQETSLARSPQGNFSFQVDGSNGQKYLVQVSTNLTAWNDLFTGTFSGSNATFTDTNAPGNVQRFYRVLPVP